MKISVALATYNGEKFILEQLESIFRQTKAVDEVVICDDRSQDATVSLIEGYIARHALDNSWRLYVNEQNLGYGENFKKAAYLCTGDVVFFCDQDDIWIPDRVEKMIASMEAQSECEVLYSRFSWFQSVPPKGIPQSGSCATSQIKFTVRNRHLAAPGCVMCVRGKFLDKIKPYWMEGWAHDDAVWNFAIVEGGLFNMDYLSLLRREHESRTSGHVGHRKDLRIAYLTSFAQKSRRMYEYCVRIRDQKKAHVYQKSDRMALLRLKLVRERKWGELLRLLPYLKYYHKKRSYLMEAKIAFEK